MAPPNDGGERCPAAFSPAPDRPHGWTATLQALAFDFSKCGLANAPRQRRRRLPLTTLRDKATTCINYWSVALPRRVEDFAEDFTDNTVHKRGVLTLERATVQSPLAIESEHLVDEPGNATGNSIVKLNDGLRHTYSLACETQQAVAFGIIKHPRELRERQPVESVVWTNNESPW